MRIWFYAPSCLLLSHSSFAYKTKRGTEDAAACLIHTFFQHLDIPGHSAAIRFADLSSAFNTIQHHLMIQKLQRLHISSHIIHLIHSFLSNRPQAVRIGTVTSTPLSITLELLRAVSSVPSFTRFTPMTAQAPQIILQILRWHCNPVSSH